MTHFDSYWFQSWMWMNANKILPFVYPRPSVITPWAHTTASVHVVTSKKQIQTLSVKVLRKMSVYYIEFS